MADFDLRGEGLRRALDEAHLPTLLPALAHLTGREDILEDGLRPKATAQVTGAAPQGGMDEEQQRRARRIAEEVITDWADRGCPEGAPADDAQLRRIMQFLTGTVEAAYVPLLRHQLGLEAGTASTRAEHGTFPDDLSVVVVGAGMSGIAAAYHLKRSGIPFQVLERHEEVGGVWYENTYPGVRLDTSNFCYSYSFAQDHGWREYYSSGVSVARYLKDVVDEFGLRESIRFRAEVRALVYDEAERIWHVTFHCGGEERVLRARAVISAVGQLNTPRIPRFEGLDDFRGRAWHTGQWDHEADLSGLRVGVVGTGASAFQVIPQVAPLARHLAVFQRTPPWVVPTPTYTQELPPGLRWLFAVIPGYTRWYRFNQFWTNVEGRRSYAMIDPNWEASRSVSQKNDELREVLAAYLEREFADRPDLVEKMVPDYPPYSKRMLRDDGAWAATLKRDNVEVVTDPIERFTPSGVRTEDGREHELDAVIFGTGFTASDFLRTLEVRGRGGVRLHDQWADDARAHVGVTVPNFPNLFLLYGPNTNLIVNGSIVMFSELEVEYVMACLASLGERGASALEPTTEALEDYYARIDAASREMAYGLDGVTNWYKSSSGRVTQNWPLSTLEFWELTRGPDPDAHLWW